MSSPAPPAFRFRLYIAGQTSNSTQAVANLNAICQKHLPRHHDIEIVDVFKEPDRALADGVMMTPTLLRLAPEPRVRIVGSLSATAVVLDALQIPAAVPDPQGTASVR